jgi:hypothetical protein
MILGIIVFLQQPAYSRLHVNSFQIEPSKRPQQRDLNLLVGRRQAVQDQDIIAPRFGKDARAGGFFAGKIFMPDRYVSCRPTVSGAI